MHVHCGSPQRGTASQSSHRCECRWIFYLPASPRTSNPRGESWDTLTRTREDELLLLRQRALAPALPKCESDPGKASAQTPLPWGGPSSHPRHTRHVVLHALLCSPSTRTQLPPQPDSQFPEGKAGSAVVRFRPTGSASRCAQSTLPVSQEAVNGTRPHCRRGL